MVPLNFLVVYTKHAQIFQSFLLMGASASLIIWVTLLWMCFKFVDHLLKMWCSEWDTELRMVLRMGYR